MHHTHSPNTKKCSGKRCTTFHNETIAFRFAWVSSVHFATIAYNLSNSSASTNASKNPIPS